MDFVTNDLKQRTLENVKNQAENAHCKMQQKMELYEASMKKYIASKEVKQRAFSIFKAYEGTGKEQEYKSRYYEAQRSLFDAESDSDILRDSVRNSISFCAKMNESVLIANSILS